MFKFGMFKFIWAVATVLATFTAQAASKEARRDGDREAIRSFSGCFEVTFDFAETFGMQPDYKIREPYHAVGIEWVALDVDSPTRMSLQHILLTEDGPMKHWREEWSYEAQNLFKYRGENTWEREAVAQPSGQWTQRVFQVDDGPRYECSAPWIRWGSKKYWECETWAPLPRRELSVRNDYNVLNRRNRTEVTAEGWMFEEDNLKLIVANAVTPLAKEKGQTRFRRLPDGACIDGQEFWNERRDSWHAVQDAWEKVYLSRSILKMDAPKDKPVLWMALFELVDQAVTRKDTPAKVQADALTIIQSYLK